MESTTTAIESASQGLTTLMLDLTKGAGRDASLDLDEANLLVGSSRAGVAAFAPVRDLGRTTADQVASGVKVGIAVFAPTGYDSEKRRNGRFTITYQVAAGATEGRSQLIDASGNVVATEPVRTIQKEEAPAANDPSVKVGDVTISVGWLHVCFDWDDPPGTPGGMCHHVCYGW